MFRTTPTAGVEQNTPMLTLGIANVAVSAATRNVGHRHELASRGCSDSMDARNHRLRELGGAIIIRLQLSKRLCCHLLSSVSARIS